MSLPIYVISPVYGLAKLDAEHPSVLAMGILAVNFSEGAAPLIEDRSVAAAPGHSAAAEKLARRIAAELRHSRPIVTWRTMPLVMPCMRILSREASAQASLGLAKALHGCIKLGLTDVAISGDAVAARPDALPSSRRDDAIKDFYDLMPGQQVRALKDLAYQDCEAILLACHFPSGSSRTAPMRGLMQPGRE